MTRQWFVYLSVCAYILFTPPAGAAGQVEYFSPQDTVKGVRQVSVRFSTPMVSFGDPRQLAPFDIACPVTGEGRWADTRNWLYDFSRDLPAGVTCSFRLRDGLQDQSGQAVNGQAVYSFNTGGPAVRVHLPSEYTALVEDQVFILGLDAPVTPESVRDHAWCDIEGVQERVGVRLLSPQEQKPILKSRRDLLDRLLQAVVIRGDGNIGLLNTRDVMKGTGLESLLAHPEQAPFVMLACQRSLPNDARVRLVWGQGMTTVSGVATTQDQAFSYRVRKNFEVNFSCDRVNEDAHCIPILPMSISFSSPVPTALARKVVITGADGSVYRAQLKARDQQAESVSSLTYMGPFPDQADFTVTLPADLRDDAGREVSNASNFPLTVKTDEYPPLVKFPATFGIIEKDPNAALPVTVRNVEAQLKMKMLQVMGGSDQGVSEKAKRAWNSLLGGDQESVVGKMLRVDEFNPDAIITWMQRLRSYHYPEGSESIFPSGLASTSSVQEFNLPKPNGEAAFEVIGIPLKQSGLYVVELESPRLGASLHEDQSPYYVKAGALVTNLSVHFKQGRESSLVWVTTLDKARLMTGADVAVRDCGGKVIWQGKTDGQGIARINQGLPPKDTLSGCFSNWDKQFFVTARTETDFSFVFSEWNEGIDLWRFNLPIGYGTETDLVTTVFDRTLVRAGETVHMKHFFRQHSKAGVVMPSQMPLPNKMVITHLGSDETFSLPLSWDAGATAVAEWVAPVEAKLGSYQVELVAEQSSGRSDSWGSGEFRVEEFRIPTMKAVMQAVGGALVNASEAQLDIQVNYLSGGGASGAEVKLRGMVTPKSVALSDYDGFVFANGNVEVGRRQGNSANGYSGDYELGEGGEEAGEDTSGSHNLTASGNLIAGQRLTLDAAGAVRTTLGKLPKAGTPQDLAVELEYADSNGEVLTSSTHVTLWPGKLLLGLKPDAWAASKDKVRFHAVVLGIDKKPRANVAVKLDLLQRTQFSHRKRLIGGFYAYENTVEVKPIKEACSGTTDAKGLLVCDFASPVSGNLIVRGRIADDVGNVIAAHQDIWVAGNDEWWFDVSNDDRMDLLPERKRYEPNETAVFQVRMPFREATALVTVEREGVMEAYAVTLTGKSPVIRVPLKGHYAPNVFVSVLAVRGRVAGVQPTALIDLGKPAFKLGIAEIKVGWAAHQLKVDVKPEREAYKVREQATVRLKVTQPNGSPVRKAEVAFAAVDEGLLELKPNDSWHLLEAMMQQRGIEVYTATAQLQVVGRRHFGRKALPPGGGGGRQVSRELFDTLLLWQGRVQLDAKGEAVVKVPLNDSLTRFRLVAVAHAGADRFGSGEASIRSTQEVMVLPGLPPLVREGDRFLATVTVRNASTKPQTVKVNGGWRPQPTTVAGAVGAQKTLATQTLTLAPGQAQPVSWETAVPLDTHGLEWTFEASSAEGRDTLRVRQKVIPAVAVRTLQATLQQLDGKTSVPIALPEGAIPGRGGVDLRLRASLAGELSAVREYMEQYPFTCLEQRASQAIALRDESRWRAVNRSLPSYLDDDGLAKYFTVMERGSDVLTAYLLTASHAAGWELPGAAKTRMLAGLRGVVQGKVARYSAMPTADLTLRKLAALAAIARYENGIRQELLGSITIDPNLWPTSAVIDWVDLLQHSPELKERDAHLREALQILRARLNFQGTTMGFSTERSDALWWLMTSADTNANRLLLALMDNAEWREDMPRLVRGSLGRQYHGHWNTTVANAWGVLAMEKFASTFEAEPVAGTTQADLGGTRQSLDWGVQTEGGNLGLGWPASTGQLDVEHHGEGRPWLTLQGRAALPLQAPLSSGYQVVRTVTPIEQKVAGSWSRGDVYRVRLEMEAQADMTWVVVRDPIPAGASILGSGLGRDSKILSQGEKKPGWVWPAFEERSLDSFRAYYEFVPKGRWTLEYTVRLSNPGTFLMPETHIEAMYAPEMFGEVPNATIQVQP